MAILGTTTEVTPGTYGAIQQQVQQLIGRADAKANAIILSSTNIILMLIAIACRWDDLERTLQTTLAAGVDEYDAKLLTGTDYFYKMDSIKLQVDGVWRPPLVQVISSRWDTDIAPIHHIGSRESASYMMYKKSVYVHPTPDQAYPIELRFYVMPTPITSTDDPLPFEYLDAVIVHAVTGLTWAGLEELVLGQHYLKLADTLIDKFVRDRNSLINFSSLISNKEVRHLTGTPWADPFTKRTN